MSDLVIACYWWEPDPGSKFAAPYTPYDVRRLQKMVARHLTVPHRFVCITDQKHRFDDDTDIHAIPIDWATHKPGTCFVRLMTFHPEGRTLFGADRILQLDLDTLIVGNIDHLVSRPEPVVLWKNPTWRPERPGRSLYNTSVLFHRCGTMPRVWEVFLAADKRVPAKDDQWYLSALLGSTAPTFDGEHDGVYRLARDDTPGSGVDGALPNNACIVTFPGSEGKPDRPEILARNPWIAEHRHA